MSDETIDTLISSCAHSINTLGEEMVHILLCVSLTSYTYSELVGPVAVRYLKRLSEVERVRGGSEEEVGRRVAEKYLKIREGVFKDERYRGKGRGLREQLSYLIPPLVMGNGIKHDLQAKHIHHSQIGAIAGAPRLINALTSLHTHLHTHCPNLLPYLPSLSTHHNLPPAPTWQAPTLPTPDLIKGETFFRKVYGTASDRLLDKLGMLHPGLAGMVMREYAGNLAEGCGIVEGVEIEMCLVAGIGVLGERRGGSLKVIEGAKRFGASDEQISAVEDVARAVVRTLPSVRPSLL
ncbi:hypothetical protein BC829DRAFT_436161 [Chytridium lagenaria]|nr:hypothetical protein BC829DRAFT_436161 [Chytridium lagenaria]